MARLIVGVSTSTVRDSREGADSGRGLELDLGDGRTIELAPQNLESEGTSWYWVDVDDEDSTQLLEAIASTPGVTSSYAQAPDAFPEM